MFLEKKGYNVIAVTSGNEALDELSHHVVDIVFLDENISVIDKRSSGQFLTAGFRL